MEPIYYMLGVSAEPSATSRSRPSRYVIAAPVLYAVLAVAAIAAILLLGSFWDFNGRIPWRARLALVGARIPVAARALVEEGVFVKSELTTASKAAIVVLGSAWFGAFVGARIGRGDRAPEPIGR